MNLKYSIQTETEQIDFHVDSDSGAMIISSSLSEEPIEVPHIVAVELISTLSRKLSDHSEKSETILSRLFK